MSQPSAFLLVLISSVGTVINRHVLRAVRQLLDIVEAVRCIAAICNGTIRNESLPMIMIMGQEALVASL